MTTATGGRLGLPCAARNSSRATASTSSSRSRRRRASRSFTAAAPWRALASRGEHRSGGEHARRRHVAVLLRRGLAPRRRAEQGGRRRPQRSQQVPQLRWGREVLLLLDAAHDLDAAGRPQALDDLRDEPLGGGRAGGHADDAFEVVGKVGRRVDPQHAPAAGGCGDAGERHGVRGVRRADDDDGVAAPGDGPQRGLAVRRRVAQVGAAGHPQVREALARASRDLAPLVVGEGRLGEQRHGRAGVLERVDVRLALDEADGARRDGHRPDGLLVAGVAHVDDGVALLRPHLELVVHLRHERAHRVHDGAPPLAGRAMRREHERRAGGDVGDVVDEDHPLPGELLDDEAVVDDLVVAVDGGLEDADHPGERLDRHLDAGAEAARLGEQDAVDLHAAKGTAPARYAGSMPFPQVVGVAPASPAAQAGVLRGDELRSVNGVVPRDVIEYHLLVDEPTVELELRRGGLDLEVTIEKAAGAPLGIEVSSPVFDRVRTCDNHCEFCFIYQLPKGMRRSLYVKDDDYRLSFLYGNFTTLTRFTELDLERVVTERLSPLYVSIHATDPEVRARLLRNRRGATSLRWLRALLDAGIEVHGQIVVCPGVNDGAALHDTLAGILERFPELASAAAVPLGVSRFSREAAMRPHTSAEAAAVLDTVEEWQARFLAATGRRLVHAADEYYLLAAREFPEAAAYEGYPQLENGVGMARAFEAGLLGTVAPASGRRGGFFAAVDGAPRTGYRAERARPGRADERRAEWPAVVLTSTYGAQ